MNYVQFYGRFGGRVSRKDFLLRGMLPIAIVNTLVTLLVSLCFGNEGALPLLISVVLGVIPLYAGFAVVVKRLHDTGRSAWWVLAVVLALPVTSLLSALLSGLPGPLAVIRA
jgi:uncharacterized membrane protein YhaH (DUF805 family)